jgi:hypothetical protein
VNYLVVVCGPAGAGKTTASEFIGKEKGFGILSKNETAKRMVKEGKIQCPYFQHYPEIYDNMLETYRSAEDSAIVDASFCDWTENSGTDYLRKFVEIAREKNARPIVVEVQSRRSQERIYADIDYKPPKITKPIKDYKAPLITHTLDKSYRDLSGAPDLEGKFNPVIPGGCISLKIESDGTPENLYAILRKEVMPYLNPLGYYAHAIRDKFHHMKKTNGVRC